jgi:hypothetical protein
MLSQSSIEAPSTGTSCRSDILLSSKPPRARKKSRDSTPQVSTAVPRACVSGAVRATTLETQPFFSTSQHRTNVDRQAITSVIAVGLADDVHVCDVWPSQQKDHETRLPMFWHLLEAHVLLASSNDMVHNSSCATGCDSKASRAQTCRCPTSK